MEQTAMEDRNRRYACDRCRGHKVRDLHHPYLHCSLSFILFHIDIHSCDANACVDTVTQARVSGV